MGAIRMKHTSFEVKFDRISLKAIGYIKPTARSDSYLVEIFYRFQNFPKVSILKPELIKNFSGDEIPHTYPGKKLCLFYPKYTEFKYSDYISDTIIPWTSLWLYHYENWHLTGNWQGGGIHLNSMN